MLNHAVHVKLGLGKSCVLAVSVDADLYMHTIRHRWEGEMGSFQHKSPHHARAFRRVLDVVTGAAISPSRHTQRCSMYFLVRLSI